MKTIHHSFSLSVLLFLLLFSGSSLGQISQEERLNLINLIRADYYKTQTELKTYTKIQHDSLEFFLQDGEIRKITNLSTSGTEEYYFRPETRYPYFLFKANKAPRQEERYYFHSGGEYSEFIMIRLIRDRSIQDTISDEFLEKGFFACAKGRNLKILCNNYLYTQSENALSPSLTEELLQEYESINLDDFYIVGDPELEEHYGVAAAWNQNYESPDGKITCTESGSDVSCAGGHYQNSISCKTSSGLESDEYRSIAGPVGNIDDPWTYFAVTSRRLSLSRDGQSLRIQEETLNFRNKFNYTFSREYLPPLD